jgi:hypothetical protein
MTTMTTPWAFGVEDSGYIVRAGRESSSVDMLPEHESGTRGFARMTRSMMVPVLIGLASFGSPAPPAVRRIFSGAAISRSAVQDSNWWLNTNDWQYTEERADADEVMALNALLRLPSVSGLELDLE